MRFLKPFTPLISWVFLVLTLPLLAAWLGGMPLDEYLRFPLADRSWDPLPFRPQAYWAALALALLLVLLPLWLALKGTSTSEQPTAPEPAGLPSWAWVGLVCLLSGLLLGAAGAPGIGSLPAGCGLLLLINADTQRRSGHCLMAERPGFFLALLPAGALTGWLMHYLDLFLQSWTYPGLAGSNGFGTVLLLTLEYALLLPLLLSLRQWLATHPVLLRRLAHGRSVPGAGSAEQGWVFIGLGAVGLAGAGIWPDRIYPLSWLAPLLLALGLSLSTGKPTLFAGVQHGDWSRLLLTALAALLIGTWDLAWDSLFGPTRVYALSLIQGPGVLGLPLPAYFQFVVYGLLGLWVADQVMAPWRTRTKKLFPDFPVKIRIG